MFSFSLFTDCVFPINFIPRNYIHSRGLFAEVSTSATPSTAISTTETPSTETSTPKVSTAKVSTHHASHHIPSHQTTSQGQAVPASIASSPGPPIRIRWSNKACVRICINAARVRAIPEPRSRRIGRRWWFDVDVLPVAIFTHELRLSGPHGFDHCSTKFPMTRVRFFFCDGALTSLFFPLLVGGVGELVFEFAA